VLALLLSLLAAPLLTRGPVVVGVAPDHAFIAWQTSEPQADGTVRFGTSAGSYSQTVVDGSLTMSHHVQLTGLSPDTEYHFAIDSDVSAEDSRFRTPLPPGARATFKFGLYGDNRTQPAPHQQIVNALSIEQGLSFLVHTGDMAENTNPLADGWDIFFALEHDLLRTLPFYPCVGNHETLDGLSHWAAFFAPPAFSWPTGTAKYSSMDWGQAHFVFLDTFESTLPGIEGISSAQVEWMKADLDAARAAGQLLFAVMHHGPYSHSLHGPNPEVQQLVVPELAARGVAAIFQGHDHVYERGCGGGLDYVLAGGGGAPLYTVDASGAGVQRALADYSYSVITVDGTSASAVSKLADGGVIDTFTLPSGACSDGGLPPAPDAGAADAGADAGGHDAGGHDAGVPPEQLPAGGCACGSSPDPSLGALPLLALLALRRRRR
jgi:MYXO-CTERM domain-containing protein